MKRTGIRAGAFGEEIIRASSYDLQVLNHNFP